MTTQATLLSVLLLASTAGAQTVAGPEPDERIQAEIRRAIAVTNEVELLDSNATLRELGGDGYGLLVPQLFLFSSGATSTREAMAFGGLVDRLRIPPLSVARALVPYLESDDAKLRRELAGVLSEYEHHAPDRPPSFEIYRPLLDEALRAGEELPAGLVRHLYATHPGTALLTLMRLLELDPAAQRPILWAERTVANELWERRLGFSEGTLDPAVAAELAALAAHPRWWARLYAASVMSQEPVLRSEGLMSTLARDTHPLVRRTAGKREAR